MNRDARTGTKLFCFILSFCFDITLIIQLRQQGRLRHMIIQLFNCPGRFQVFFFGVAKEKLRFPYCTTSTTNRSTVTRSCQGTTGGKHERVGKSRKWLVSSLSIYRRPELGNPQLNLAAKSATPFCSFNQTYLVDKPHERPVVRTRGQLSK